MTDPAQAAFSIPGLSTTSTPSAPPQQPVPMSSPHPHPPSPPPTAPALAPPPAPTSPTSAPESAQQDQNQHTRFLLELEFLALLASPPYLNFLASQKYLTSQAFINYLAYLQYWTRPEYVKFLHYPGPSLRHLELLQDETFRKAVLSPDVVARLMQVEARDE